MKLDIDCFTGDALLPPVGHTWTCIEHSVTADCQIQRQDGRKMLNK